MCWDADRAGGLIVAAFDASFFEDIVNCATADAETLGEGFDFDAGVENGDLDDAGSINEIVGAMATD